LALFHRSLEIDGGKKLISLKPRAKKKKKKGEGGEEGGKTNVKREN